MKLSGLTKEQLQRKLEVTRETMNGLCEIEVNLAKLIEADFEHMSLMQGILTQVADLAEDMQGDMDLINRCLTEN